LRWQGLELLNFKYLQKMNNEQNVEGLNVSPAIAKPMLPAVFVGQVLFREKFNRNAPSEIVEVTVGKVGKKYFYLTGWAERYPIDKETLKYTDKNYSQSNFQLYRDKQEILDRREKSKLFDLLQKHFNWSGNGSKNTLEQLRKVVDVLGL
jgi:hypothetical protein